MSKRQTMWIVSILALFMFAVGVGLTDAYTYTADDTTDYDWADGVYSIWAFAPAYVSVNTGTGIMTARGAWTWNAVHTCKLWMALEFVPPTTGRVHCSASFGLSYKLIAGTVVGGFSSMQISLILMDSSHNPLETDSVYYREAYCYTSGVYDYESGTPYVSDTTVYWSYTLQSSTTYYATVEIYLRVFNGGYAYSYAGAIGSPTTLTCDIAEICVYT